ncbi:response regulator [Kribbella sp. NPDC059898]|uniref:response regulator n=1 Tax=Kribbella sp. NPDC059898 TaxID=3346995 RepID=UPI003667B12A
MIRVVLAEDQQLVRAGLRMVIDSQPDLTVVAEAGDGLAAVEQVRRLRPDVVVMDVRMPKLDGIEATARITPGPAVLMLTTYDLDEYVLAAVRAGAGGFLLKDAPPEDMLAAIRTVHAGDAVLAASTTRRLLDQLLERVEPAVDPAAARAVDGLTAREREVLVSIARGWSNAEIAERLTVSAGTVKTHVSSVLAKLGIRDRVQAVVFAYEAGLVRPGSKQDTSRDGRRPLDR